MIFPPIQCMFVLSDFHNSFSHLQNRFLFEDEKNRIFGTRSIHTNIVRCHSSMTLTLFYGGGGGDGEFSALERNVDRER